MALGGDERQPWAKSLRYAYVMASNQEEDLLFNFMGDVIMHNS